jgi:hypothetical protein
MECDEIPGHLAGTNPGCAVTLGRNIRHTPHRKICGKCRYTTRDQGKDREAPQGALKESGVALSQVTCGKTTTRTGRCGAPLQVPVPHRPPGRLRGTVLPAHLCPILLIGCNYLRSTSAGSFRWVRLPSGRVGLLRISACRPLPCTGCGIVAYSGRST